MSVIYNLTLKRGEIRTIDLPDLKTSGLVLRKFEVKSDLKSFDIKIFGKDTIVNFGEAVFYQTTQFDLSDKLSQIATSSELKFQIKNLCTSLKDANTINLSLLFEYTKHGGYIIHNNMYSNLTVETLPSILADIKKSGKHIKRVVFSSPAKLSALELKPQFTSEPQLLKPMSFVANSNNLIILDLAEEQFDPDFVDCLPYYNLELPPSVEKLGVTVYGFAH